MSRDLPVDTQGDEHRCGRCGQQTRAGMVKSAFWERDRLVVIEDIPARVCDTCAEQYYDDTTIARLDLLRGRGLSENDVRAVLQVPVFTLKTARPPEPRAGR